VVAGFVLAAPLWAVIGLSFVLSAVRYAALGVAGLAVFALAVEGAAGAVVELRPALARRSAR
jgi:hypothetical protein